MNVRNNKDVEFSVSNELINDEVKKKIALSNMEQFYLFKIIEYRLLQILSLEIKYESVV